jgi:phage terminase small subunit
MARQSGDDKKTPDTSHKSKEERARRKEFVRLYLLTGNAAKSAEGAGYSKRGARQQGHRLLTYVDVRKLLHREYQRRHRKFKADEERLVEELTLLAFSDLRDVAVWDEESIRMIPSDLLAEGVSRTIKEISGGKFGPKIKLYDKDRAAELLAKILGLLNGDDEGGDGSDRGNREALFERIRIALQKRAGGSEDGGGQGCSAGASQAQDGDGS